MALPRPLVLALPLLLAGCSNGNEAGGTDPTRVTPLTEDEVESFVTDEAVDLAAGSSVGGSRIVTEEDLSNISWGDLADVPEELLDGDDDTLVALGCAEGQWARFLGGAWTCVDTLPLSHLDTSGALEGDVLLMTATGPRWVDVDTLLASVSCPSGAVRVGDVCVENAARPAATWMDAVATCAADGAHLCAHVELAPACLTAAVSSPANPSGLEWTSDRTANGQAAVAFGALYDCDATAQNVGSQNEYRCCTGAR